MQMKALFREKWLHQTELGWRKFIKQASLPGVIFICYILNDTHKSIDKVRKQYLFIRTGIKFWQPFISLPRCK